MKKKVILFIILLLTARFIAPSSLYAAGSIELTSTAVGDTVTITAMPDAKDCPSSLSTFAIAKVNFSEHDSTNDRLEWSDESLKDDYPVDLSKAKVQVFINEKNVEGVIQKSDQDFIVWLPEKNEKDFNYPQFFKDDTIVIKITDARITQPGQVSFSTTVLLYPTLNSCFGFGMPTTTKENGILKKSFKTEYTFEFNEHKEDVVLNAHSITPRITAVTSPKKSNEKNGRETTSQSSTLLHLLSESLFQFVR